MILMMILGKQDSPVCCSLYEYGAHLHDHPDYDHDDNDHPYYDDDYDDDDHHDIRTPLLLSLLHNAGEQTIRQLLSLGEDPGARDMVNDHDHNDDDIMIMMMIS